MKKMDIYHNKTDAIIYALIQAESHRCNYNIIIANPTSSGEYNRAEGSTYEVVRDSFFESDELKPPYVVINSTDNILNDLKPNKPWEV